jgi:hypothetical protein
MKNYRNSRNTSIASTPTSGYAGNRRGNSLPFLNVLLEKNPDSLLVNTIYRKHTYRSYTCMPVMTTAQHKNRSSFHTCLMGQDHL